MSLIELQDQIYDWGRMTFNSPSALAIAIRGQKEMTELISHLYHNPIETDKIAEECADVMFFLLQVCAIIGHDLEDEVRKKFEINLQRSWVMKQDGSYQHEE